MSQIVQQIQPVIENITVSEHEQHEKPTSTLKNIGKGLLWVLKKLGFLLNYIFSGQFIVDLGHKIVLTGGHISETAMMISVLWITANSVAPSFTAHLGSVLVDMFTNMSLIFLTLLPEIILFSAIVVSFKFWYRTIRKYQKKDAWVGEMIWAILYTIPTMIFIAMTIMTIATFGDTISLTGGAEVKPVTGTALIIRCLAGWIYSLFGLVHAEVNKFFREENGETPVREPVKELVPAPPVVNVVPEISTDEVVAKVVDQLMKKIPAPAPVPVIDYEKIVEMVAPLVVPAPAPVPVIDYEKLAEKVVPLLPAVPVIAPVEVVPEPQKVVPEPVKEVVSRVAPKVVSAPHKKEKKMLVAPVVPTKTVLQESVTKSREERLEAAFFELQASNKVVSARALAKVVKCNRKAASEWLQEVHPENVNVEKVESEPVVEVVPEVDLVLEETLVPEVDPEPVVEVVLEPQEVDPEPQEVVPEPQEVDPEPVVEVVPEPVKEVDPEPVVEVVPEVVPELQEVDLIEVVPEEEEVVPEEEK